MYHVIISYHDFFWFDITVQYVLCMTVIDSLEQLLHVVGSFEFIKLSIRLLADFLKQSLALNELHDQVDEFHVVVSFVVLNYVGMIELAENSDLLLNPIDLICTK